MIYCLKENGCEDLRNTDCNTHLTSMGMNEFVMCTLTGCVRNVSLPF